MGPFTLLGSPWSGGCCTGTPGPTHWAQLLPPAPSAAGRPFPPPGLLSTPQATAGGACLSPEPAVLTSGSPPPPGPARTGGQCDWLHERSLGRQAPGKLRKSFKVSQAVRCPRGLARVRLWNQLLRFHTGSWRALGKGDFGLQPAPLNSLGNLGAPVSHTSHGWPSKRLRPTPRPLWPRPPWPSASICPRQAWQPPARALLLSAWLARRF